ncbi:molybdopterin-dependent oxidoreductase, partial [Salmonella enterica subsp. enterica serovar Cerro]|nr:molybdopterin-dependent oxidoreductase [Salmonella enterica subsp. enterica serovar Cerro]
TDTAAGREDEWIPIRPGTDAALVAGIAWVLINENLVDQPFLESVVGADQDDAEMLAEELRKFPAETVLYLGALPELSVSFLREQ